MLLMRMMISQNKTFAIMCAGMGAVSVVMAIYNYKNEGMQYRKDIIKRENGEEWVYLFEFYRAESVIAKSILRLQKAKNSSLLSSMYGKVIFPVLCR